MCIALSQHHAALQVALYVPCFDKGSASRCSLKCFIELSITPNCSCALPCAQHDITPLISALPFQQLDIFPGYSIEMRSIVVTKLSNELEINGSEALWIVLSNELEREGIYGKTPTNKVNRGNSSHGGNSVNFGRQSRLQLARAMELSDITQAHAVATL